MRTIRQSEQAGYTMMELLIYTAILAVMAVLIIQGLLAVTLSFGEVRAYNMLRAGGNIAMERMLKEVRFANAVTTASSTLALLSSDEAGAPKTVEFAVSSGTLSLAEDGINKGSLTGNGVTVTSLVFREATTSKGSLIKIEMTLTDARLRNVRVANFYGSAVLRGSY